MKNAETLRMTLSDVAALAQVQRPVVSMWRKRSAASAHPFPAPAALDGGRELFDADQVGAWLEATGRGNNTEARYDAAAFAAPALQGQRETFNALTSLLAVKVLTGGNCQRSARTNYWTPRTNATRTTACFTPNWKRSGTSCRRWPATRID